MLATLAGLAAAFWAFGEIRLADIFAVATRIGAGGFLLYCLYSLTIFVWLGAAWLASAPGEVLTHLPLFSWARLIREAVADLLPFSQIGGIVVGMRTVIAGGVAPPRVYASFVVDLTTEMASQLVFTLSGLALLVVLLAPGAGGETLSAAILGGTVALAVITFLIVIGQRAAVRFAGVIAQYLLPGSVATTAGIGAEMDRIYAQRRRVACAFAFNLGGWIASALGGWIGLHLMGVGISVPAVLALESLIFTLRSVAFAVPGGLGVQEAAYALIGPLLGLPLETALAFAVAKRARDVALGLPTLLIWQISEARAALRPGRKP